MINSANRGLLPVSTVTELGTIARRSLTAYQMTDGSWVSFDRVHGRPAMAEVLVIAVGSFR